MYIRSQSAAKPNLLSSWPRLRCLRRSSCTIGRPRQVRQARQAWRPFNRTMTWRSYARNRRCRKIERSMAHTCTVSFISQTEEAVSVGENTKQIISNPTIFHGSSCFTALVIHEAYADWNSTLNRLLRERNKRYSSLNHIDRDMETIETCVCLCIIKQHIWRRHMALRKIDAFRVYKIQRPPCLFTRSRTPPHELELMFTGADFSFAERP